MQPNEEWKKEIIFETFKQNGHKILCAYHPLTNFKVFIDAGRSEHSARVTCFQMLADQMACLPSDFKAPEVKTKVIVTLEFSQ